MADVEGDPFASVRERVHVELLRTKVVAVVGVGTVGSQVAHELARTAVGGLIVVDGGRFKTRHLARHVLTRHYVGMNKAEALAHHLTQTIEGLRVDPIPRNVDESRFDAQVDKWLERADLIVATTDDRGAQRRVARRALLLDTPAVLPALYRNGGGEVFLQFNAQHPCFFCYDGFRTNEEPLRAVAAANVEGSPVIQLAVELCLAELDQQCSFANLLDNPPGDRRPRQIFIHQPLAALSIAPARERPNCPSCGPLRRSSARPSTPPTPPRFRATPPRFRTNPPRQPGTQGPNGTASPGSITVAPTPPQYAPPQEFEGRTGRGDRLWIANCISAAMIMLSISVVALGFARADILASIGTFLATIGTYVAVAVAVVLVHVIAAFIFVWYVT
jgi:hypothetical protein